MIRFRLIKTLPLLMALLILLSSSAPYHKPLIKVPEAPRAYRQVQFFNQSVYENAKEFSAPYQTDGTMIAAILPHHATASVKIASLFKTVSGNTFDTVIIIAPNHTAERGAVVTSACDWLTPFGRLQNDDAFSELLAVSGGLHAVNAPEVMEADHSASYLFPFVKDYLPESRISAVLIARTAEKAQVQALTEVISSYAEGKRVLVIGSADFSHFLMPGEAAKRDEETIKAIEKDDEATLLSMTNSNLDSPQTLLTVMGYAKKRGIAPLTLLDHSSSDRELGMPSDALNPKEGITTYLLYAALRQ